jgi:hypothetical protein
MEFLENMGTHAYRGIGTRAEEAEVLRELGLSVQEGVDVRLRWSTGGDNPVPYYEFSCCGGNRYFIPMFLNIRGRAIQYAGDYVDTEQELQHEILTRRWGQGLRGIEEGYYEMLRYMGYTATVAAGGSAAWAGRAVLQTGLESGTQHVSYYIATHPQSALVVEEILRGAIDPAPPSNFAQLIGYESRLQIEDTASEMGL